MKICIVVPIYNEASHLKLMLDSLLCQSRIPDQIILVNDQSTDDSQVIIDGYIKANPGIQSVQTAATGSHQPGAKVVSAFYEGLKEAEDFDLIGKFDADIVLPPTYFEILEKQFENNPKLGMASGHIYIEKEGQWVYENIAGKDKVRGPIKLYRKACFEAIGGLRRSIGWDTTDELLARIYGWEIATDPSLKVKHLKPTGALYSLRDGFIQGQAFRRMRYGPCLSILASAKLALKKRNLPYFFICLKGYLNNGPVYIVSEAEGKFIRKYRWHKIKKKLFL